MLTVAVGHSDDVDPLDAIATAMEQCAAVLGDRKPQAGILFSSFDSFDPRIVGAVRDRFPGVGIMGSTSAAQVSSVLGFQEDSIALALFASDTVDVTVGLGTSLGMDVQAACRSAVGQALAGTTRKPAICMVLAEGYVADPQHTVDAIARALPDDVLIIGGTSARADFVTTSPTYQFCNDIVVSDGVAVLLFSGPVAFSSAVGTGWKTLGPTGTVTRSEYGSLHEIDGRPAIEFVEPYLDTTGPATYGNPLAVTESGAGDFYLRAIQSSDPATGSLLLAGSVPVGATVQLTTADRDAILKGTEAALGRAVAEFPAGSTPEAALLFSCAVRKYVLGSRTQTEGDLTRSVYGATLPFAGMYCYGEIGAVTGTQTVRFLNESFVTVLMGT